MDDHEFDLVHNAIFPLFPYAKDQKWKRVFLKVYSGPGRLDVQLLCKCRLLGFILYPGVPNTMAFLQETDHNYGPFKIAFLQILNIVVQNCITANKSTSLPQWIVGIVVFGGTDTESKKSVDNNSFNMPLIRSHALILGPRLVQLFSPYNASRVIRFVERSVMLGLRTRKIF